MTVATYECPLTEHQIGWEWPETMQPFLDVVGWGSPAGYRVGEPFYERGLLAADMVSYELGKLGNDINVPDFLLADLRKKRVSAREVVWVCRTEHDASRYLQVGTGPVEQRHFGPRAIVLAFDCEEHQGFLVLYDAAVLDPQIIIRLARYRISDRVSLTSS
jgi:hypothetical protein